MSFQLPSGLPPDMGPELKLACLAGGFDNAPGPTRTELRPDHMTVRRTADESGFLITPWQIEGAGRLMASTSTLIERAEPYSLAVELARGKINQLRNHLADWGANGVAISPELERELRELNREFGHVLARHPSADADDFAQVTLQSAFALTRRVMPHVADELFRLRHLRNARLDSTLACQLPQLPANPEPLVDTFNAIRLNLGWRGIEPVESHYQWDAADAVLDWAAARSLPVSAGPLIDFSTSGLPDWLTRWEGDLSSLANFMCDYVETVIARYRRRINRWFVATGCNVAGILGLGEDDLLWLTARLAEAALQIAPNAEIVLGVSQPWADYMARDEHTYTPLVFLDTLLRTGLKLAALDIEIAMGVSPDGSYCRDLLEVSRLLDSYAVLSTPVQVTLAVPSAATHDPLAQPDLGVGAGEWADGFTPRTQADFATASAAVALAKPFVGGICWAHASDAHPHRLPNCGAFDANDRPKPVLAVLRQLRQQHLR